MNKTKIQHINKAYKQLTISGITTDPDAEEVQDALEVMEDMMGTFESEGICTSYNFEEAPSIHSNSQINQNFNGALSANLAINLAVFFGKSSSLTPDLIFLAKQGKSTWMARTAKYKQINPPRTMPRGSGNSIRAPIWARYYRFENGNPLSCDTMQIRVGQTDVFAVDFAGYLTAGETVTGYTIAAADTNITISSSSLADPVVNYEMTGVKAAATSVLITITTSLLRVFPERVNVNVVEE